MSIRVILADDHRVVRQGLRSLLENKMPDVKVIAEAGDGRDVVGLVEKLSPDVVVMDISMPNLNGIEATRRIVAKVPGTKVVALSMHSDRRFVLGMLTAGASGYILKDCAFEEIARAVHAVAAHQTYLSSKITDVVVKHIMRKEALSAVDHILTVREREVLQLIAEGKSMKEIALGLKRSVKTVETYRQQIMHKLGIFSVAELTKHAIREGLTTLE